MGRSDPERIAKSSVRRSGQPGYRCTRIDYDAAVAGRIELEEGGGDAADSDSADADSDKFDIIKRFQFRVQNQRSEPGEPGNCRITENHRGGFGGSGPVHQTIRKFVVEPESGLRRERKPTTAKTQ